MKLYDKTNETGQNYRNPVLYRDFSDPDVIRVGEDYYMVASSFTYLPVPAARALTCPVAKTAPMIPGSKARRATVTTWPCPLKKRNCSRT